MSRENIGRNRERGVHCGGDIYALVNRLFDETAFAIGQPCGPIGRSGGVLYFDGVAVYHDERLDLIGERRAAYVMPENKWQITRARDRLLDMITRRFRTGEWEEQPARPLLAAPDIPAIENVEPGDVLYPNPYEIPPPGPDLADPDGLLG